MSDGYRKALQDDESLGTFLKALSRFDREFCNLMAEGTDFTIKLEIHGNNGELIHARVNSDGFERPRSKQVVRGRKSSEKTL